MWNFAWTLQRQFVFYSDARWSADRNTFLLTDGLWRLTRRWPVDGGVGSRDWRRTTRRRPGTTGSASESQTEACRGQTWGHQVCVHQLGCPKMSNKKLNSFNCSNKLFFFYHKSGTLRLISTFFTIIFWKVQTQLSHFLLSIGSKYLRILKTYLKLICTKNPFKQLSFFMLHSILEINEWRKQNN